MLSEISRLVWYNIFLKDTKSFQRGLKAEGSSLEESFEWILLITGLTVKTNYSALFSDLMALSISDYSPETWKLTYWYRSSASSLRDFLCWCTDNNPNLYLHVSLWVFSNDLFNTLLGKWWWRGSSSVSTCRQKSVWTSVLEGDVWHQKAVIQWVFFGPAGLWVQLPPTVFSTC